MHRGTIEGGWERLKDWSQGTAGGSAREAGRRVADQAEESIEAARARFEGGPWRAGAGDYLLPVAGALAAFGIGAGLMYFFDPVSGRRRRALVRDQFAHLLHEAEDACGDVSRYLGHEARVVRGMSQGVSKRMFGEDEVSDRVLEARVREALGRAVSHPGSIQVTAHEGRVRLDGPVLAGEMDSLRTAVSSVPGVKDFEHGLDVHDEPGDVPGLQGGRGQTAGMQAG